jgi:hypothetical protein
MVPVPVVADRFLVPVVSVETSSCPPSAPAGTAIVRERFRLVSVVLLWLAAALRTLSEGMGV